MLKVKIIGQDTLAAATRTCCAKHFDVTSDAPDILWVCYDTPITHTDKPDVDWVIERIGENLPALGSKTLILVSSQVPVGTTRKLEESFPSYAFAHSPENIRVASAVRDFEAQSRIVVGRRNERYDHLLSALFSPFTQNLIFTDPETAEMVKHALNCYLAMSIAFINEVARVAAVVGADANGISQALLLERRVSPNAPLRPGAPFGLGHLARDVFNMNEIAARKDVSIPIIAHIKESNSAHATQVNSIKSGLGANVPI